MPQQVKMCVTCVAILAVTLALSCSRDESPGHVVRVFAAASTTDAVQAVAERFEQAHDAVVECNFAASSTLARQIAAGAACDLYLSADPTWVDYLFKHNWGDPTTRRDALSNRLVLIAPKDRPFTVRFEPAFPIEDAFPGRVALGDPAHVPAGKYARQALEALGWWARLEDRLAPCMDVRAALHLVELGETRAGIVYATDAAVSQRIAIVGRFPEENVNRIRYQLILAQDAGPMAQAFASFMTGPDGARLFERYGFTTVSP